MKTKSIMKKLLLFTVVILFGVTTMNAQVKFGFGLGYVIPSGDASNFLDGGFSGNLEVGYGVNDAIDVSLIYQGDLLIGKDLNNDGFDIGNVYMGSILVNGRYFFKNDGFRPYAGLGLGVTSISQTSYALSGIGTVEGFDTTTNLAIRPSLGFKYGILNVNAVYINAGKVGEGNAEDSIGNFTINAGLLFTFGGK